MDSKLSDMEEKNAENNAEASGTSWWLRPAGGREVLGVAWPLVISCVSWTVLTFVDRVFLKLESGEAMSAAFSAATVWFAVICIPLGICTYASTFVAQYHGDRWPQRIGPAVWHGVWVAVCAIPLVPLAIWFVPQVFDFAAHGTEIVRYEKTYFTILCFGAPALLAAQAFSSFYSGRGKTSVVMWIDASFAALNLLLDYCWIFGHAGFPALGIAGAGWATVVSLWLKVLVYLLLIWQPQHRLNFNTWGGMRLDRELMRRLLYYGGPSGVQIFLDVMGFTTFILLVSRIGMIEAEATTMAFSVATLAFMPVWGIGLATSILVGQRLGEDNDHLAARSTWTAFCLAEVYMVTISLFYLFVPWLFLDWFFVTEEGTPADQAAVYAMATNLLRFVAAYNLLDAMLMIFVSAIKGAGDTQFVLKASLVMGALLAYLSWQSVEVWQLNIYQCWALITAWIWLLGIVFLLRFRQGKWRKMRVIESHNGIPSQ